MVAGAPNACPSMSRVRRPTSRARSGLASRAALGAGARATPAGYARRASARGGRVVAGARRWRSEGAWCMGQRGRSTRVFGVAHVLWLDLVVVLPLAGLAVLASRALRAGDRCWSGAAVLTLLLIAASASTAHFVEPARTVRRRGRVPVGAVRSHPLRVVVIADLQFEWLGSYERRVVSDAADAQHPARDPDRRRHHIRARLRASACQLPRSTSLLLAAPGAGRDATRCRGTTAAAVGSRRGGSTPAPAIAAVR